MQGAFEKAVRYLSLSRAYVLDGTRHRAHEAVVVDVQAWPPSPGWEGKVVALVRHEEAENEVSHDPTRSRWHWEPLSPFPGIVSFAQGRLALLNGQRVASPEALQQMLTLALAPSPGWHC